jgi:hypothetical protein
MDLSEAIVRYGTKAVLRYRAVAGLCQDNEIPEIFLGGFIACAIHDELKANAHVERFYTVIARELGAKRDTEELMKAFGGNRADIVIYQERRRPVAIIELKVFDERIGLSAVVADRDKMRKLSCLCDVECYLGVLVTDISGALYTERVRALETALEHKFDSIGAEESSINDAWHWCFASGRFA